MKRKQKEKPVFTAIHIGATAPAISAVEKSILSVINTPAGDAVKIEAIKALAAGIKVEGATVANCQFMAEGGK